MATAMSPAIEELLTMAPCFSGDLSCCGSPASSESPRCVRMGADRRRPLDRREQHHATAALRARHHVGVGRSPHERRYREQLTLFAMHAALDADHGEEPTGAGG